MHRGNRQCKEQKQPRQQQQTSPPPSLAALSAAFPYRNAMPTDEDHVRAIDRRRRWFQFRPPVRPARCRLRLWLPFPQRIFPRLIVGLPGAVDLLPNEYLHPRRPSAETGNDRWDRKARNILPKPGALLSEFLSWRRLSADHLNSLSMQRLKPLAARRPRPRSSVFSPLGYASARARNSR